ncbi:DUF6895 family protein [Thermodesulfobacteriota bacterium]
MDEKSNHFLREFLNPIRKTDDNLSIRLSILFTLKHIAPKKFRELKLNEYLESVISDINEIVEKPTSLLGSVISKMRGMLKKQRSLYDLQAKLDYWYYTKLLGYGDQYRVNDEMIKISMTDEKIKSVTHPRDSVLIYIYIRALSYCDSEKYGQFNKYISLLRKAGKKDANLYAYFLTHVVLYDTHFGQKKAPKSSLEALNELHDFCKNKLKFERENIDLMSEIIICCKLCQSYDFPFYSKLVSYIMPTETFRDYHESAVLAAATFE